MDVNFTIYIEPTEHDVVWWAESAAIPGLSVAAPTLRELRVLIEEAVRSSVGDAEIGLELATDLPSSDGDSRSVTFKNQPVEISQGDVARFKTTLVAA